MRVRSCGIRLPAPFWVPKSSPVPWAAAVLQTAPKRAKIQAGGARAVHSPPVWVECFPFLPSLHSKTNVFHPAAFRPLLFLASKAQGMKARGARSVEGGSEPPRGHLSRIFLQDSSNFSAGFVQPPTSSGPRYFAPHPSLFHPSLPHPPALLLLLYLAATPRTPGGPHPTITPSLPAHYRGRIVSATGTRPKPALDGGERGRKRKENVNQNQTETGKTHTEPSGLHSPPGMGAEGVAVPQSHGLKVPKSPQKAPKSPKKDPKRPKNVGRRGLASGVERS